MYFFMDDALKLNPSTLLLDEPQPQPIEPLHCNPFLVEHVTQLTPLVDLENVVHVILFDHAKTLPRNYNTRN